MKACLIIILVFFFFSTSGHTQSLEKELQNAYEQNSQELYGKFLEKWSEKSKPLKDRESLTQTERDVYEIFEDFYTPFDVGRLSRWFAIEKSADMDDPSPESGYIVVQNTIEVVCLGKEKFVLPGMPTVDADGFMSPGSDPDPDEDIPEVILSESQVLDFSPDLKFKTCKVLYATSEYEEAIFRFLGDDRMDAEGEPPMHVNLLDDVFERLKFLKEELSVEVIDGFYGWRIFKIPRVSSISFNRDRTMAEVNYWLGSRGGGALYEKKDGKWVFVDAALFSIT